MHVYQERLVTNASKPLHEGQESQLGIWRQSYNSQGSKGHHLSQVFWSGTSLNRIIAYLYLTTSMSVHKLSFEISDERIPLQWVWLCYLSAVQGTFYFCDLNLHVFISCDVDTSAWVFTRPVVNTGSSLFCCYIVWHVKSWSNATEQGFKRKNLVKIWDYLFFFETTAVPLQSVLQLLLMVQNTFRVKQNKMFLLLFLQPFQYCEGISYKNFSCENYCIS